ncbi:MarR family transcriptional regulator [Acrocarpospora corrugata]|uniref:MarR family transcriptional regulator n=1 Tax=Acrocarpospora corrugata TaxID=35763 RepID=A0A5M3W0V4_9ACTN|nr:MarR family transcriptional regulator [Acrocarpospora corrugata]GES02364.1 MarR family transcriptional regulator [Acrocarpospora corrugata]
MTDTLTDVELAERLRATLSRLARRARQHAPQTLTASQRSTLSALDTLGPVRLVDLAIHEGVSAPTQSRLVASLESSGLTTRTPDPADGRASLLSLTDEGHRHLAHLREDRSAFFIAGVTALTPAQRTALTAALPALESLATS